MGMKKQHVRVHEKEKENEKEKEAPSPSPSPSPTILTRAELLKRRMHNLRLLSKCYRHLYWSLIDRLKPHFTHYLWHFGLTPFRHHHFHFLQEGSGETNNHHNHHHHHHHHLHLLPTDSPSSHFAAATKKTCAFLACKLKAMPLTTFCHLHILSDSRQKLYKPCSYVIKSAEAGPITCGKPTLRSTVPCLCIVHFQKAQKHLTRTFKRAGLTLSPSSKKFHLIVTEYVRQIQAKRPRQNNKGKTRVERESDI